MIAPLVLLDLGHGLAIRDVIGAQRRSVIETALVDCGVADAELAEQGMDALVQWSTPSHTADQTSGW